MKSLKSLFKNSTDIDPYLTISDNTTYETRAILYKLLEEQYQLIRHISLIQQSKTEDIK